MRRIRFTAAAAAALGILAACATREAPDPAREAARAAGVEILGVQLLADGALARLRYRVIEPEKARAALRGEPRLLAEDGTGALAVTSGGRLGPLRQRPSASGREQFMLFTNSGQVLKRGGRAVLEIGALRVAGIPIT
jgi:hypothetical protein